MATLAYPMECPCCESTLHSLDDLKTHLRTRQSQVQALEDQLFRIIERTEPSASEAIEDTQRTDTADTGSDETDSPSETPQLKRELVTPEDNLPVNSDSRHISDCFIDQSENHFMQLLKDGCPQYIDSYRVSAEQRCFELRVTFKEGTGQPVYHWIPEATVQKFDNAAVCTYWHARVGPDGKPAGRPYGEVDVQVLKIVGYKDRNQQDWERGLRDMQQLDKKMLNIYRKKNKI